MPVSAFAAISTAVESISLADVGIGAAIGGAEAGLTGGNILEGAAFGGLGGGLADVGSSLYAGSALEGGVNSLASGIGDSLNSAGNSIESLFSGGGGQTAGGALTNAGTDAANGINAATGSAIQGTTPGVSGAASGGGFTSPDSLLSNTNQGVSTQLGGTGAVSGATTPNPTSLGSLGSNSDLNTIGKDLSEPGTSSNFETGGSLGSASAPPGLEAGGSLPSTTSASSSLPSTGAIDSLGVPGGVAPPLPTSGASALPDTSSSSFGDQVSGFFNNASNLKYALPAGELVSTRIQGPQKLPSSAQALEAGGAVTGPLLQTEKMDLNAYNTQTLTPGQQSQVDQFVQQQQNALYQQLAGSGVTNPQQDSRYIQGMQQIQQQVEAMKSQLLGQDLSAGEGAAGQAGQDLFGVAQLQNQQDQEYQAAIEAAVNSFSQMSGGDSVSSIEKLLKG